MRLEYKSDTSQKFWEARHDGKILFVTFGKIGTSGQTIRKLFASAKSADAEYRKIACEKLSKGYKPTQETVNKLLDSTKVEEPRAIGSVHIGELVSDEIVADICRWTTACIQCGMTPKQFKNVWRKLGDLDDELNDTLGQISEKVSEFESSFWHDVIQDEGIDELYETAVKHGGDRFIWFNDNADIDIVALRGDPGVREIEVCVLEEKNCKDEKGEWLLVWPDEVGPGAPIAEVCNEAARLRDGTWIGGKWS